MIPASDSDRSAAKYGWHCTVSKSECLAMARERVRRLGIDEEAIRAAHCRGVARQLWRAFQAAISQTQGKETSDGKEAQT